MEFDLDEAALAELEYAEQVLDLLDDVGDEVATVAAVNANKLTGAGAASIHGERDEDSEGPCVDVSWDREHFYMEFAETGTEHQSATPFLRPALDATQI